MHNLLRQLEECTRKLAVSVTSGFDQNGCISLGLRCADGDVIVGPDSFMISGSLFYMKEETAELVPVKNIIDLYAIPNEDLVFEIRLSGLVDGNYLEILPYWSRSYKVTSCRCTESELPYGSPVFVYYLSRSPIRFI